MQQQPSLDAVVERIWNVDYWRALNPALSISQAPPARLPNRVVSNKVYEGLGDWMRREGYCKVPPVMPKAITDEVRTAVATVEAAGWLPAFCFLYDAPWIAARLNPLRRFVESILGPGYRMLPDFWAWHVKRNGRGYRPHREVGGPGMELPNGDPTAITVWIPLTDATIDNGCMYVIPLDLETEKVDKAAVKARYGENNNLGFMLHRVRALPARTGSLLSWNHLVFHWGTCSNPRANGTRQSFAFEFVRGDLDPSFHPHSRINPESKTDLRTTTMNLSGPLPSFEERVFLIARNMRSYYDGVNDPYRAVGRRVLQQGWPTDRSLVPVS
ncbi:MAG: phytanoyl-CoA dioxygenase family protein [Candidatus Xenobia bacterium]